MCESHVVVCERLASSPEEIEQTLRAIGKETASILQEREAHTKLADIVLLESGVRREQ
jgi:hypothetical protein